MQILHQALGFKLNYLWEYNYKKNAVNCNINLFSLECNITWNECSL